MLSLFVQSLVNSNNVKGHAWAEKNDERAWKSVDCAALHSEIFPISPYEDMSSFENSSFGAGGAGDVEDSELKAFLAIEGQKAKFQNQVHMFTDVCWDRCIDKPGSKLDGKTETCLVNCVERFIDSTLAMTNRFQQLLNKQAGH